MQRLLFLAHVTHNELHQLKCIKQPNTKKTKQIHAHKV